MSKLDRKIALHRPVYERKKDAGIAKSVLHWAKKDAHIASVKAKEAKRWDRRDAHMATRKKNEAARWAIRDKRLAARRAAGGTFEFWMGKYTRTPPVVKSVVKREE